MVVGQKEAQCNTQEEFIEVIVAHKLDLLFNRQLRIHRENPDFEACFLKTNELTIPGFLELWARILNLKDQTYLAGLVLKLTMENFYLQITDETLNPIWLRAYFKELQTMIHGFKQAGSIEQLDASV